MFVDEAGALWLSNPWIVGFVLAGLLAMVAWCHQWLETGRPPMPHTTMLRNQSRVMRTRALRTQGAPSASAVVPLVRFTKDPRSIARARAAAGLPRSA
jgi:hypothetical protein